MRWSTRRWKTSCVQPWCSILDSALRALATTWPGFHAAMLYTVNDFCGEFPTCDLFLEFSSCKLRQPWARAIFSGFCERLEKVSLLPHYLRRHQESRNPIWGTLNQFQGQAIKQNKIWEFHAHCKFMQNDEIVESWLVSGNHIIPVSGGRHLCGSCTEPLVDMVGSKTGSMPIAASPWEVWPPDVLQIALTFSGKSRSLRNLVWTERKHSQFLDGELSWAATCGLFWRLFSLIDYMKCKPKLITPFVPPKGPGLRSCPSKWGWLIAINLPFDQKI